MIGRGTPAKGIAVDLNRNRFLSTLPQRERRLIEPHLRSAWVEQGKVLYEQGGQIDQVYFPLTGMVSVVAILNGGQVVEVATIGREGAIGLVAGFGPAHAFNRAIVQVTGFISGLDRETLERAVRDSEALRNHIIKYNELVMAQLQQGVACNALHRAEARLARWLLQTRDRIDSDVIPLTQEFLAEMLGVRRPTVTEIALELQGSGLIHYRRGRIEIVAADRLADVACECYDTIRRRTDKYFPVAAGEVPLA